MARKAGLCCRAGIPKRAYVAEQVSRDGLMLLSRYPGRPGWGAGRGTRRFFLLLCWSLWRRCVHVSFCCCNLFFHCQSSCHFSVGCRSRSMVFSCLLCPTFVHLFVTPWGVPGLQSNIVFHHLAQGTVGQADLLGICHCILGPSAQGEWNSVLSCYVLVLSVLLVLL